MTKDRIVQVLKNLKFTTTHYQVPVEVIPDAQFEAAAEQILLLMQTNDDTEPQLKQADVSRSKCDYHAAFTFCGDNGITYCSNCGDPV